MKNFNVTLITLDEYPHALALLEAAQYVHWCLVYAGYGSALTTNYVNDEAYNIIFCAHLLAPTELERFPDDTIVFNSEQLQNRDAWYFDGAYRQFLDKFYVWDYSLKNMPLIGHDRSFFIPFLFCPDLVRTDIPRKPGTRLSFYGASTDRRKLLFQQIEKTGVPLDVYFGKYGAERDVDMFNAWAVLNMRQNDKVPTFEPVRCFYPLTNNIPVISEAAYTDPTFGYYKDWVFAFDTANLARGIAELYGNPEKFAQEAAEKLAAYRATSGPAAIAEAVDVFVASLR